MTTELTTPAGGVQVWDIIEGQGRVRSVLYDLDAETASFQIGTVKRAFLALEDGSSLAYPAWSDMTEYTVDIGQPLHIRRGEDIHS